MREGRRVSGAGKECELTRETGTCSIKKLTRKIAICRNAKPNSDTRLEEDGRYDFSAMKTSETAKNCLAFHSSDLIDVVQMLDKESRKSVL